MAEKDDEKVNMSDKKTWIFYVIYPDGCDAVDRREIFCAEEELQDYASRLTTFVGGLWPSKDPFHVFVRTEPFDVDAPVRCFQTFPKTLHSVTVKLREVKSVGLWGKIKKFFKGEEE